MSGKETDQARAYIRGLRRSGRTDEEIRQLMLRSGWAEEQLDDLFGVDVPPPPAPEEPLAAPGESAAPADGATESSTSVDVRCPRCGASYDAAVGGAARVASCPCGTRFTIPGGELKCPSCDEKIYATDDRCVACGALLDEGTLVPPPAPPVVWRWRRVHLLILAGFLLVPVVLAFAVEPLRSPCLAVERSLAQWVRAHPVWGLALVLLLPWLLGLLLPLLARVAMAVVRRVQARLEPLRGRREAAWDAALENDDGDG
jgi:hypothetical protein